MKKTFNFDQTDLQTIKKIRDDLKIFTRGDMDVVRFCFDYYLRNNNKLPSQPPLVRPELGQPKDIILTPEQIAEIESDPDKFSESVLSLWREQRRF